MTTRLGSLLLVLLSLGPQAKAQPTSAAVPTTPGRHLPVVAEHHYMVTGSVWILLWKSRDNVGSATLRWRGDGTGRRAYEMVIGSDPERAPRKINRWGYIAEEVGPGGAALLGVMKASDEATLAEAEKREAKGEPFFLYKAIRTEVSGGEGRTGTAVILLPHDPTYRDVESLLAQLPASPPAPKEYAVAAGTRPGYLPTLQELVDETVAWHDRGRPANESPVGRVIRYAYNGTLYNLVLKSSKAVASGRYRGRTFSDLIDSEFVITNTTTGEKTRFELQYGRKGALAGVPVHGAFRPRWWFEVQITKDDGATP